MERQPTPEKVQQDKDLESIKRVATKIEAMLARAAFNLEQSS